MDTEQKVIWLSGGILDGLSNADVLDLLAFHFGTSTAGIVYWQPCALSDSEIMEFGQFDMYPYVVTYLSRAKNDNRLPEAV